MKPVFIEAIGLCAPGLHNWQDAKSVLLGMSAVTDTEPATYQPQLLPPNERRRATASVRLAFRVAEEAMSRSAFKPSEVATVFASSEGDTAVLHRLCSALAQERRQLSPTDFHNSVHNAAAGYWSIAARTKLPSVSLSAYDHSFCSGLLEAATLALGDYVPVLFVTYDICPPEPLHATRPLSGNVGAALLLTPIITDASVARLEIHTHQEPETSMSNAALESLRLGNPAARVLPLLEQLARSTAGVISLEGTGGQRWSLALQPL
jgi:hypothetical protein